MVSMGLVTTIMMATLVVGPFYLSGILGLSLVQTGLVMSVGPAVSALAGAPAGRLVDRFGAAAVAFCGLSGLITGASAMGAVFALGSKGGGIPGYGARGEAGRQLTFLVAAALAGLAIGVTLSGRHRS